MKASQALNRVTNLIFLIIIALLGISINVARAQEPEPSPPWPPRMESIFSSQVSGDPDIHSAAPTLTNILDPGDGYVHGLIYDGGYLWASTRTSPARVLQIDPTTLTVMQRAILTDGAGDHNYGEDIKAANGFLWVVVWEGPGGTAELIRVDPTAMTWNVAITFGSDELWYGSSLEYAFGYLWVGGSHEPTYAPRIAQVDLSDLSYQIHDYAAVKSGTFSYVHGLSSDPSHLWASVPHASGLVYTDETVLRINPGNPTGDYQSQYISGYPMPDDIVNAAGYLFTTSEVAPSELFKIAPDLSYITDTAKTTESYGTFRNPLDPEHVWGAFVGAPGTIAKYTYGLTATTTITLPAGFNDANEMAFDELGNMYVTAWISPTGVVRYDAPAAITDLRITRSGNDAVLSWTHGESDVVSYQVWRATDPYFTPGVGSASKLAELTAPGTVTATVVYADTGAIGDTSTNYYYEVQAINGEGLLSPLSNRVGEIDFSLNNTGNKYSLITVPFASTSIVDAASLANYIGGVTTVLKWNPATQAFRLFSPPSTGDNFSIAQGDAIYVYLSDSAPNLVTFVGEVTSIQYNLVPGGYNFISMPLQRSDLYDASSTAMDITNVFTMLKWNENTQAFRLFVPPSSGDNFALKVGDPFIIDLNTGGPTIWP